AGAAAAPAAETINSTAAVAIFPKVIANLPEFKAISCRRLKSRRCPFSTRFAAGFCSSFLARELFQLGERRIGDAGEQLFRRLDELVEAAADEDSGDLAHAVIDSGG